MKIKSIFIIIAITLSVWAVWSGALGAGFEKMGDGKSQVILTIDKKVKTVVQVQQAFHNISQAAGEFCRVVFSSVGGTEVVKKCQDEPILFGGLFIFFGVSLCGIGFVIHMIRTDSRFS